MTLLVICEKRDVEMGAEARALASQQHVAAQSHCVLVTSVLRFDLSIWPFVGTAKWACIMDKHLAMLQVLNPFQGSWSF